MLLKSVIKKQDRRSFDQIVSNEISAATKPFASFHNAKRILINPAKVRHTSFLCIVGNLVLNAKH